ncbi:MAG TPA: hypothetical protein VNM92_06560 [Thermoanaerobaculia bacterium]|nr:hypothetical protein [Thermoanaerobaculia bacterium]
MSLFNRRRISTATALNAFLSFSLSMGIATTVSAASTDVLSLVPADATTVGMIRLSDMRNSPLTARLFSETDRLSVDGEAKRFLKEAGLDPARDVDVLVAATSPRDGSPNEPAALVLAEGRFNVARLSAAIVTRGAKSKLAAGKTYFLLEEKGQDRHGQRGAVAFVDSGLVVAGSEESVIEALQQRSRSTQNFRQASIIGRELSRIDTRATAWALIDLARTRRFQGALRMPGSGASNDSLASAMKSVSVLGISSMDTGDALKISAFGISNDAETRDLLEDTLRGVTAAWRLAAQEKAPELVSALRKFNIDQSGDSVTIEGTIPAALLRSFANRAAKHHAK